MDAKTYWDTHYTQKPFSSGKGPSDFLHQMLPRLEKGKVLDIGMGEGQNAVYLAQKGFAVKGFDISKVAVEHAKELARDTAVIIDAQSADLDLYLFGIMEYDSIVMTKFRPGNTRYYTNIVSALKQGGTLLIESYGVGEMNEAIGKDEEYRNYYYHSNEILKNILGLRILFYQEGLVNDKYVVQCLAQKPIDKDAAKLKLFDMSTKKNDVESSKHLELAEKLFKK
ncbi:MAG: class I SAM-dependent methyltransferase [Proteobacteria bacterium]|nr:MAG: class I SAM-dependent methyltransferase [Pseudomonadota bacterium]